MSSLHHSDEEDSFESFLALKSPVKSEANSTQPPLISPSPLVPPSHVPESRLDEVFDVSMDKWLGFVEDLSFKTRFLPLSREEAASVLRWLRCYDIIGGKVQENKERSPDVADLETVRLVTARIQEALNEFPQQKGFVKLSTRSPKDAVFDCWSERTAALVDKQLAKGGIGDDNSEVAAFFSAANSAMCSESGAEAMDLFLKSARVRQDVERALKKEEAFDLQIVCREFVDLPLQSEFRGFVFEKRLVAISQYFWFNFFPDLVKRHNQYLDRMVDFFEFVLKSRVPYESYVVDFAVLDDKIIVIELNPFGDVSGACCFNWTKDKLLLHGKLSDKTVLRVRLTPMSDLRNRALVPVWDKYLLSKRSTEKDETSATCFKK